MGQLRFAETFEFSDWQNTSRYRSCSLADRRHWAWLWLKRDAEYQRNAARVANAARWTRSGKASQCLVDADLKSLFRVGYLFIRIARVMAIGMPGFSGRRISIRPSSVSKPNQYPQTTPTLSTSPGSEPWPT